MAVTQNTYTGDGSTVLFSFTFPYLETTDIKVSLDGSITTAYTLANATTIQFNTAPGSGVAIRIYRQTDDENLSAQFYSGSAIRASDLNDNFTQNLYVTQEVNEYAWDNEDDTVKSTQAWVSSDAKVATTAAIDARFQDEIGDTIDSNEAWVSDNDHIASTAAIDGRIDEAITNDIATDGTGITVTDDGDGTITLGLGAGTIDLDRIKDEDIITYAEQEAGNSWLSDTRIPTTYAAARRFDTLVQPATPTGSNWAVGKTWLQNDQDLTVSVWNGSAWLAVASGGAFTNQPKVVYVDATAGDDNNDGHRISRPKATIKAAIAQINADATYGDGSVVMVAPGVYQEVAPIDITKKDVSIIGTALRSCIIHPTPATEENSLFRVNSGTFLQNLTLTGVKASGVRGAAGSIDPDGTYGLPPNQGWNVSFYPGAMIYKSPYIQNCTNFSDSEIDNANLNAHTPAGGSAGDTDSAPTGGGLLIDGSVVNSNSPLRSMVCDSYTHVGLDGPGILVTNNGYAQCTSSYAFFNHYHIKCLNGGQANLAASTTDFGRYGLIADGRSTSAIFTATTTANAADQDITFTIDAPVVGANWHGSATRPQSNMLVDIGGNTYPILSAVPNGAGWDVTISRPNPLDKTQNLGLDGAVSSGAAVSFYLRSMVASSGHTMEYCGSGTNYSALPENGGVPVDAAQIVELNNGKVWTAITDQNGKFKLGNFFIIDQQSNSISVSTGSFPLDLSTLAVDNNGNALLGANLDLNGNYLTDSSGNVSINDVLTMNTNKIINVGEPSNAQDAATKNYVDSGFLPNSNPTLTSQIFLDNSQNVSLPDLAFDGDGDTGVTTTGADELALVTGGTARLTVDSTGAVSVPGGITADLSGNVTGSASENVIRAGDTMTGALGVTAGTAAAPSLFVSGDTNTGLYSPGADQLALSTNGTGRLFVDSSGNVGIGVEAPATDLHISSSTPRLTFTDTGTGADHRINADSGAGNFTIDVDVNSETSTPALIAKIKGFERFRITSDGKVGIGTTSPAALLNVSSTDLNTAPSADADEVLIEGNGNVGLSIFCGTNAKNNIYFGENAVGVSRGAIVYDTSDDSLAFSTNGLVNERARIDSSGRLLVGTSSTSPVGLFTGIMQLKQSSDACTVTLLSEMNSSFGSYIFLGKSRGANGLVSNGDTLGEIVFAGGDGTDVNSTGASIRGEVDGTPGANDMPCRLVFSTTADGASSPTERMRITSSGRFNFNTGSAEPSDTVNGTQIHETGYIFCSVDGSTAGFFNRNTSDGTLVGFRRSNVAVGSISVTTTATAYNTSSDYRLKENVLPLTGAADRLNQLQVKRFNFIADPDKTVDGFLAHEAQAVVPECVTGTKDEVDDEGNPVYQGIDQSKLVPLLTAALQEALGRIETLEAEVATLKSS